MAAINPPTAIERRRDQDDTGKKDGLTYDGA